MACSHRRPNNGDGAKEDNDNDHAGDVGCGNHFVGGMVVLMGSGAMMTMPTKSDEDARPPQEVATV
jgi:hypothetical protein